MNLIFTAVAALSIGYIVRNRTTGILAYLIAESFVFTVQTLDVLLSWLAAKDGLGGAAAFGPFPRSIPLTFKQSEVMAYALVNSLIAVVGIGLVILANRFAGRKADAKAARPVG